MTTKLLKPVSREALTAKDGGRPLILSLDLGDTFTVRLRGSKQVYRWDALGLYQRAVIERAAVDFKSRRR